MAQKETVTVPNTGEDIREDAGPLTEGPTIAEVSDHFTAIAGDPIFGVDASTAISDPTASSCRSVRLKQLKRKCGSEVEYEIESSKAHWTEVEYEELWDPEKLKAANCKVFERLVEQWRPKTRKGFSKVLDTLKKERHFYPNHEKSFFRNWGADLEMGEKIAEGGQAEIFDAKLNGYPGYVVKAFKSGYSLADQERQWPRAMLQGCCSNDYFLDKHYCFIHGGTVLKDGRFAFVIEKCSGDLRKLIDRRIMHDKKFRGPPFEDGKARLFMLEIAKGMRWLHSHNILHRDLKASNVLLSSYESGCKIADFDSSVGVQGTKFWRAPEVLRALKNDDSKAKVWTSKVDVYSYGMTCYEILTGRIPFEDLAHNDYDVVISGERPPLPDYVDPSLGELVRRCWHWDPSNRPTFEMISMQLEGRNF